MRTNGLHHVTAVAGDPEENRRFYTDTLGSRLVKRTVNFDDTTMYHLYYGNTTGGPGTAITFFTFQRARPGRPGRGQAVATAFAVPPGSLDYWANRLADSEATVENRTTWFGAAVRSLTDPDGGERRRYVADGDHATVVDVLTREPPRGRPGVGTVHHVAFRAADDAEQDAWRERIEAALPPLDARINAAADGSTREPAAVEGSDAE